MTMFHDEIPFLSSCEAISPCFLDVFISCAPLGTILKVPPYVYAIRKLAPFGKNSTTTADFFLLHFSNNFACHNPYYLTSIVVAKKEASFRNSLLNS